MEPLHPPPVGLLDKYEGRDVQPLYSTTVTVTGGDAGHGRASGVARSDDGNLDLDLRMSKTLGGPGGGTNPEQLFAAGYAACFHGAPVLLAARAGIAVEGASVSGHGRIRPRSNGRPLRAHRARARSDARYRPHDGGGTRAQHGALLPLYEDGA